MTGTARGEEEDDILVRDIPVFCKLGVWFCFGMCECFCGGRLKSCLLSVQSC